MMFCQFSTFRIGSIGSYPYRNILSIFSTQNLFFWPTMCRIWNSRVPTITSSLYLHSSFPLPSPPASSPPLTLIFFLFTEPVIPQKKASLSLFQPTPYYPLLLLVVLLRFPSSLISFLTLVQVYFCSPFIVSTSPSFLLCLLVVARLGTWLTLWPYMLLVYIGSWDIIHVHMSFWRLSSLNGVLLITTDHHKRWNREISLM